MAETPLDRLVQTLGDWHDVPVDSPEVDESDDLLLHAALNTDPVLAAKAVKLLAALIEHLEAIDRFEEADATYPATLWKTIAWANERGTNEELTAVWHEYKAATDNE